MVSLDDGRGSDDPLSLILEVTGERKKDKVAKTATVRSLWVPSVNNHGGFGRWAFLEIVDPYDDVMGPIRADFVMSIVQIDTGLATQLPWGPIAEACRRHGASQLWVQGPILERTPEPAEEIEFLVEFLHDDFGAWGSNNYNGPTCVSDLKPQPRACGAAS